METHPIYIRSRSGGGVLGRGVLLGAERGRLRRRRADRHARAELPPRQLPHVRTHGRQLALPPGMRANDWKSFLLLKSLKYSPSTSRLAMKIRTRTHISYRIASHSALQVDRDCARARRAIPLPSGRPGRLHLRRPDRKGDFGNTSSFIIEILFFQTLNSGQRSHRRRGEPEHDDQERRTRRERLLAAELRRRRHRPPKRLQASCLPHISLRSWTKCFLDNLLVIIAILLPEI